MLISDLNYLEVVNQETEVVGGRTFGFNKNTNINVNESINLRKNIYARVDVQGNTAFAEADAQAYGNNSVAQGITVTYTDPYSSIAGSQSSSATN